MSFFFIWLSRDEAEPGILNITKNSFPHVDSSEIHMIKGPWQGIICKDKKSNFIQKDNKTLFIIQHPPSKYHYQLNLLIPSKLSSRQVAFLLAEIDPSIPSVQLARDRFGRIGCYLYQDKKNFILSSSLKPLFRFLPGKIQISLPRLAGFLYSGLPPNFGEDTLFEHLSAPAPGFLHYFDLRSSTHDRSSYILGANHRPLWEPASSSRLNHSCRILSTALNRAVFSNLPHADRAALELSGGVDSSILAAELKKIGIPFRGFSVTYPCCKGKPPDESGKVKLTARTLNVPVHWVRVRGGQVFELTDKLTSLYAEPLSSPGMIVSWMLERFVKEQGFDFCFSGLAGDMLLGELPALFLGALLAQKPAHAFKEWRHWKETIPLSALFSGAGTFLSPALRKFIKHRRDKALSAASWLKIKPRLPVWYESDAPDYPTLRLEHEMKEILPMLLGWQQRRADDIGLEVITPYTSIPALSELARIPASHMVHAGYNKYLARLAYSDILPCEVLWDRTKLGFEVPLGSWVSDWDRQLRESILGSATLREILDLDWIERHWEALPPALCWRLFAAARFCEVFENHLP